ncbi:DUF1176 domain-containing protein [Peteryoungia desertarenae]|uniref:DUF1176 domain-containing protein n=1 Tax=Peteryoungia desertarenae TaxID=1813451 RepID=A0ABX6QL48_9HYPH|nr:DUF1176 domain-containing protein [Peteryoungia desertarenae]QLF69269.1 DUF1176 domain-containing protein [Peteryoungia desertarenae]
MTFRMIAGLALLTAVSAGAVHAAEPRFGEFGDWRVNCSQALNCVMEQFVSGAPLDQIALRRDAGPETAVTIAVWPDVRDERQADGPWRAVMTVDGGRAIEIAAPDIYFDAVDQAFVLSGPAIDSAFIDEVRNGETLRIEVQDGDLKTAHDFSLRGVAASLLFIDEVQGRIDRVDALSARGDLPPADAIALKDIRRFSDLPEAIRDDFGDTGRCAGTDESSLDGDAIVHAISANETLYLLPCGMSGAYNMPYALYLDSFGNLGPMPLPVMLDKGPSTSFFLYNAGYNFETGVLDAFFKGRGLGDCGQLQSWVLTRSVSGSVFVLTEERVQDCDGSEPVAPENWPALWPVQQGQ